MFTNFTAAASEFRNMSWTQRKRREKRIKKKKNRKVKNELRSCSDKFLMNLIDDLKFLT